MAPAAWVASGVLVVPWVWAVPAASGVLVVPGVWAVPAVPVVLAGQVVLAAAMAGNTTLSIEVERHMAIETRPRNSVAPPVVIPRAIVKPAAVKTVVWAIGNKPARVNNQVLGTVPAAEQTGVALEAEIEAGGEVHQQAADREAAVAAAHSVGDPSAPLVEGPAAWTAAQHVPVATVVVPACPAVVVVVVVAAVVVDGEGDES